MKILSAGRCALLFAATFWALSGCGNAVPQPTATAAPSATDTTTGTFRPTATFTPTSTYTATATPNPILSQGDPSQIVERMRLGKGMMGKAIWSHDSKTVLVSYSTGIYRFDASTMKEGNSFETTAPAYHLVISPDGSKLASNTGKGDRTILLWNASSGEQIETLQGPVTKEKEGNITRISQPAGFQQMQFSPDGKTFAALAGGIYLWNAENGKYMGVIETPQRPTSFVFSPDGNSFLTGDRYGVVRSYNAADGKLLKTIGGIGGDVVSMKFSPSGAMLALSSYGADVYLWRMPDGVFLRKLKIPDKSGLASMDFSPDGSQLAGLSYYGGIYVWQAADGKILFQAEPDRYVYTYRSVSAPADWERAPQSISFSPDGSLLLQQIGDNSTIVRHAGDWAVTGENADSSDPAGGIAFLASDNSLEVIGEGQLIDYSIPGAEPLNQLPLPNGFGGPLYAFSADGSLLASDCWKANIESACVWKPADGSLNVSYLSGRYVLTELDLSPDGSLLAAVRYPDETTRLWSAADSKILRGFDGRISPKFSPDGSLLALEEGKVWVTIGGSRGFYYAYRIHFVETTSGQEVGLISTDQSAGSILAKAFSPDGKILAATSSGQTDALRLWSVPEGKLIRLMEHPGQQGYSTAVAFSPDGKIVAVGDWNGFVRIWRMDEGKLVFELRGHMYRVLDLVFSADGKWLVSSSADGTVRVWGIKS